MNARCRLLPWLCTWLLATCGGEPAGDDAGHRRMVEQLADLARQAAHDNVFFGQDTLRANRAELARLGERAPWRLRLDTGTGEVQIGREREGITILAAAREALRRGSIDGDVVAAIAVSFHLGVAWMRVAETENCCARPTDETCVLPLRGTAVHAAPEGATNAAHYFVEVLQNTAPNDYWHLSARWMLNIAHMALGTYPDGVPARFLIPPRHFAPERPFPRLRDVAPAIGLDTWGTAGGIVVEDFDGDEHLDVLASDWAPTGQLRFFRNERNGTWADHTEVAGLIGITGGLNLVHADYDNDGDVDVMVLRGAWSFETGRVPNSLLRNDGRGRFTDVTFAVGLAEPFLPTQTAAFADYDLDGDLDLFVGNENSARQRAPSQLFRNDGGGTFTDVADLAGVRNDRYSKGAVWGDVDGDRWPDLYVNNNDGPNRLYHNRGDGTFEDIAERAGVTKPEHGFTSWFFDYDNDGALDLFAFNYDTGIGHIASHLLGGSMPHDLACFYHGDGHGHFTDETKALGFTYPAMPMGCNFGDIDNDGFPDFFLGTGDPQYYTLMPNLLFRNDGGHRFLDVTMASGAGNLQKGHGVAFADLDHDGDQDIVECLGGAYPGDAFRNAVLENPGFLNHWITLRLVGTESNRSAIGARIRIVVSENGVQRCIHKDVGTGGSFGGNPLRQTIGLGKADRIVSAEILWPKTGLTQVIEGLPVDGAARIVEGEPGFTPLVLPVVPFHRR